MITECQLSNNTKAYIEQFQCILTNMIDKMCSAELTDSISGSFIIQMIPHHRGAIEMSENLLQYTTNIPLQNIALNIISSQRKSIKNMMKAYQNCQSCFNFPQEKTCYQEENTCIIQNMFHKMNSSYTDNDINANFIREMIPHHEGAVLMSENALQFSLCPELIPLLEEIIVSQKKGIRQMQQLLLEITC